MDLAYYDIAFEAVYISDEALESGIKDFISSIVKHVKDWWIDKALPFIKRIAKNISEIILNLVEKVKSIPKKVWSYIVTLAGKFKAFFDKNSENAITVDDEVFEMPPDAFAGIESTGIENLCDLMFNDNGISMEAAIRYNSNTISEEIFGKDASSVEEDIENYKNSDPVNPDDMKKEANRIVKAISGTIDSFTKTHEKAYKNFENSVKNEEDPNKASKKANHWMSKASTFFKAVSDFFNRFFNAIKTSINEKKK